MSSAFNSSEKNKVVSLEQDSTLKWRGLLNNTYASKESKHMRNRNEKSSSENPTTSTLVEQHTAAADISNKVDVATETESKAEQKQENNVDTNSNKTEISSEPSEKSAKMTEEIASNNGSLDVSSTEMVSKPSTDKTHDKTPTTGTHDKKSSKGTKAMRNVLDVRSDRSLRSKGSVSINSDSNDKKSEEPLIVDDTTKAEESSSKQEDTITPVKRGRGRKKKLPVVTEDKPKAITEEKAIEVETPFKSDTSEEKPRIVVTIRQNRSTNPIVIPSSTELKKPVVGMKKRGRRSKQSIMKEQSNQEQTHILTRSAHKDDGFSKRPLRRIRPTAKILANDELREGFVQQNCARLNITNEEIQQLEEQNAAEATNAENKRQTRDTKRRTRESVKDDGKSLSTTFMADSVTSKPSPGNSSESPEIKRSLSFSDTSSSSKISYTSNIPLPPPPPLAHMCPDPVDFLREIRNAKLVLPKSPEDNKKLNKKQHKRLMRMKEKHFFLLGLKRNLNRGTDSEDLSDECDEFVPARKVVAVGKPGVTLRLRHFRKEEQMSGKKRSPNVERMNHQANRKRRVREPEMDPNAKKKPHQDSDVISKVEQTLVPVSMSTPIGMSSSSADVTSTSRQMLVLPATNQSVIGSGVSDIIDVDNLSLICLCIQPSKYFLQRTAAISHCCAIDEVEGQKIGCTNEVHGDLLQLLRPSVRTSYMVLCESHKKRLVSHNCCAGCGVFLTQGIFSLCPNKHFFHRDCTMKYILNAPYDPNSTDFTGPTLAFKCPHCAVDVPDSSFRVTMKSENVPVFFTNQKHHM